MKKSRVIILVLVAILSISLIVVFGYRGSVIAKAKTGYMVYANEKIVVIDLEETTKTEYSIDGYSNCDNIGKYYGGDFSCRAINNKTNTQEILLFKNGSVERSYPVTEEIISLSAFNDIVYYLTKDGSLNCISNNETKTIANNVEEYALNSLGELVYIQEIADKEDSNIETDDDGMLYYSVNGKTKKLGEANSVIWLSDNELLVNAENVAVETDADGNVVSASHVYDDYIVTVDDNQWTFSKEFNKIPFIVNVSSEGKKAITETGDSSYTYLYLGIYDIEKDIFSKKAIHDGIKNEDVFGGMYLGMDKLWLDENPMK